jgi:hypothetical protein
MRRTTTREAIRCAVFRLGLHTKPKAVVHALRERGIQVDEQLVQQVHFALLKESSRARIGEVFSLVPLPDVRRRPQGFPATP